jgi:nicotinamidase-related amidase
MSVQAGICDARQLEVSQDPAQTAVIVVDGNAGESAQDENAKELSGAAVSAGMLVIRVNLLPGDAAPWRGAATPGTSEGCSLRPGDTPNIVHVRSDRAGHFLASNIGLIMRSNGMQAVVLAGDAPSEFAATLGHTLALQGYPMLAPADATDARRLGASWRDDRKNRRNWQPQSKAADLLTTLEQRIDPHHAALMLIDVQNDFCDTRGAVGRSGEPVTMISSAVARIKELLAAARAAGVAIIHVRAEYGELYRGIGSPYRFPASNAMEPAVWTASAADLSSGESFAANEVEVCLPGTWGQQFVDGIVPRADEPVITKHRFSAFVDTGLDPMLRARGIKTVILAGVTTNCCVESTAREVAMRDFYLVVAADCVAVKDRLRSLHDASLESMRLYFGQVRPAAELIGAWDSAGLLQASAKSSSS